MIDRVTHYMPALAGMRKPFAGLVALPAVLVCVTIYILAFLSGGLSLPEPFDGYNGQRWGALLLLAVGAAAGGRALPAIRSLRLPLALFLAGLVSTALAPYPAEALAVLAMHAGLLLLAWTCARAIQARGAGVAWRWRQR